MMKSVVLLELAKRWKEMAEEPEVIDGSENAEISNDEARGRREGMRMCADSLEMIVSLLGTENRH